MDNFKDNSLFVFEPLTLRVEVKHIKSCTFKLQHTHWRLCVVTHSEEMHGFKLDQIKYVEDSRTPV